MQGFVAGRGAGHTLLSPDDTGQEPGGTTASPPLGWRSSSALRQSAQEVPQLKVIVSASPAWEVGLDGGVNAFLPSARALKCCEERGNRECLEYASCYVFSKN